ncbi:MAG: hypothetical protein HQL56_18255 [Magnetococcales bacterium]|nr:hypothetical protein [Magnetococcales bacterium]
MITGGMTGGIIDGVSLGGVCEPTGTAAPAWTPLSLGAKLLAWHDPSDASCTMNGGNFAAIPDLSGNGHHASNANASTQPLSSTMNGLRCVASTGTRTLDTIAGTLNFGAEGAFVASVVDVVSESATINAHIANSGANGYFMYNTSSNVFTFRRTTNVLSGVVAAGSGKHYVAGHANTGTNASTLTVDETVTVGTLTIGTLQRTSMYGTSVAGTYSMLIGDVLHVDNPTAGEIVQIKTYLEGKWGIV